MFPHKYLLLLHPNKFQHLHPRHLKIQQSLDLELNSKKQLLVFSNKFLLKKFDKFCGNIKESI